MPPKNVVNVVWSDVQNSSAAPTMERTASTRCVAKKRSAIMPTKNGEMMAAMAGAAYTHPTWVPENLSVWPISVPMVTSHEPYTKYWMNISTDKRVRMPLASAVVVIALT